MKYLSLFKENDDEILSLIEDCFLEFIDKDICVVSLGIGRVNRNKYKKRYDVFIHENLSKLSSYQNMDISKVLDEKIKFLTKINNCIKRLEEIGEKLVIDYLDDNLSNNVVVERSTIDKRHRIIIYVEK